MDTYEKLYPESPEAICQIIRDARSVKFGVIPCGKGHLVEQLIAPTGQPVKLVSTLKLNAIEDLDVNNLSVKVQAGMTLAELDRAVREHNLFLPITVESHGHRTLGGLVAEDAAGYESYAYDTIQNHILGLEFITPYGTRVMTGGKTVKNVSGYDFTRLFARSWGTLGIITSITFKLRPQLEKRSALLVHGLPGVEEAYRLAREIRGARSSITALRIFKAAAPGGAWQLVINLGGFQETVTGHLAALQKLCAPYEQQVFDDCRDFWRQYYEQTVPDRQKLLTIRCGKKQIWNLAGMLSQVVKPDQNYFCDIDLGLGEVIISPPAEERQQLRQQLVTLGGDYAFSYSWVKPPVDPLYQKLKAALDPDRIMFPCHPWLGGEDLD